MSTYDGNENDLSTGSGSYLQIFVIQCEIKGLQVEMHEEPQVKMGANSQAREGILQKTIR